MNEIEKEAAIFASLNNLETKLQSFDSVLSRLLVKIEPVSETTPSDEVDPPQEVLEGSSDICLRLNKITQEFVELWTERVESRIRKLEI